MDKEEKITGGGVSGADEGLGGELPAEILDDVDLLLARYGIVLEEEEAPGPALPPAEKPPEEPEAPAEGGEAKGREAPPPPKKRKKRKRPSPPPSQGETAAKPEAKRKPEAKDAPGPEAKREPEAKDAPGQGREAPGGDPFFAVEDVVADTVDSVLEERRGEERRYSRQRRENQRRRRKLHRAKASRAAAAEEFEEEEPSLTEASAAQKRRYKRLRSLSAAATALTLLYWAPTALSALGIELPRYTEDPRVFAAVSAALQGLVCLAGWPVFLEGFGRFHVNCYTCAALGSLLTLADTLSILWMEGRVEAGPLGGVSAAAMCLSLWGECWRAGALREGFRLAAIGDPSYVVDLTENGAMKRRGRRGGFYSRAVKEDAAAKWQKLALPVVLTASAVFAVLCSYGSGAPERFLWCWSAILTAGTALALPCVYTLPYFVLSSRLGKSGCAVAGLCGARQLSRSRALLVGDEDLFPPGAIRLKEVKIIREDKRKAASYAGSLAAAFDCGWTGLLVSYLHDAGGQMERLDHFHVHVEGGVSASIYGETAVLGTANLIRKLSIRLPKSMEEKDALYLSIDAEVCAIFCLSYQSLDAVRWSLGAMRRNGLSALLMTRDPNLTPKFLKGCFGVDGGAVLLDLNDRLNLSDPDQEGPARPNALIYREGLAPCFEAVAGSKRLCRAVGWGNVITLLASAAGTLLSFYLIFAGSMSAFYPPRLLLFMGLWLLPVLLLSYNVDKI